MTTSGKFYLAFAILIAVLSLSVNTVYAESNAKGKLINSIVMEQKQAENNIVNLWMAGDRGKKLEATLAEYVVLEVRQRALASENKNKTLLVSVSNDPKYKPDNYVDLAREVVLEYFKRKGIDLKGHRFVKGNYLIETRD